MNNGVEGSSSTSLTKGIQGRITKSSGFTGLGYSEGPLARGEGDGYPARWRQMWQRQGGGLGGGESEGSRYEDTSEAQSSEGQPQDADATSSFVGNGSSPNNVSSSSSSEAAAPPSSPPAGAERLATDRRAGSEEDGRQRGVQADTGDSGEAVRGGAQERECLGHVVSADSLKVWAAAFRVVSRRHSAAHMRLLRLRHQVGGCRGMRTTCIAPGRCEMRTLCFI